jgi:hypothetical protein
LIAGHPAADAIAVVRLEAAGGRSPPDGLACSNLEKDGRALTQIRLGSMVTGTDKFGLLLMGQV